MRRGSDQVVTARRASPTPRLVLARSLTTTSRGETIARALEKLAWSGARALAVIEDRDVVGIVDARMLAGVRASWRRPLNVGDVMSAAVTTAPGTAEPRDWARLFESRRLDGIAVVDRGVVVGIVHPAPPPPAKRRATRPRPA